MANNYFTCWYAFSMHFTEIISQTSLKITKASHLLKPVYILKSQWFGVFYNYNRESVSVFTGAFNKSLAKIATSLDKKMTRNSPKGVADN